MPYINCANFRTNPIWKYVTSVLKYLLGLINMMHHAPTKLNQFVIGMWFHITIYFRKYTCHICTVCANSSEKWSKLFLMWRLCWVSNKLFSATPLESQTTYTQWRHKSKISEKLGRCGRKNMLWPYPQSKYPVLH